MCNYQGKIITVEGKLKIQEIDGNIQGFVSGRLEPKEGELYEFAKIIQVAGGGDKILRILIKKIPK